jgi:hypothetical protein
MMMSPRLLVKAPRFPADQPRVISAAQHTPGIFVELMIFRASGFGRELPLLWVSMQVIAMLLSWLNIVRLVCLFSG